MNKFEVTVNDKTFQVTVEKIEENQGAERAIMSSSKKEDDKVESFVKKAKENPSPFDIDEGVHVTAPLAGSIFSLSVKTGEKVSRGQVLLTLEALKMENEILAPESGTVLSIMVDAGDVVNTGDALMIIKGTQGG